MTRLLYAKEQMLKRSSVALLLTAQFLVCVCNAQAQSSDTPAIESPTLSRLAVAIDGGNSTALTSFWTLVASRHGPLIEEIPNHPADILLTFLWRGQSTDPAFAVRITSSLTQSKRPSLDRLNRLRTSDVWYLSYTLPKRAAIGYAFILPTSANAEAPLIGVSDIAGVSYGQYRDPFNPKTVQALGALISYVEGPESKSTPYLVSNTRTAKGKLAAMEIDSKFLGGRRRVDVYTPADYQRTSPPDHLVLMFDGDVYASVIPTPSMLDNMIAKKVIPPVIVAFLFSPDRDRDLFPNDAFQSFLTHELMPQLRDKYGAGADSHKSVVAGFSLGGLAAIYAAQKNPAVFGNVIAQSPSLWWSPDFSDARDYRAGEYLNSNSGAMIKVFAESSRLPIRFYVEVGEWEETGALLPGRLFASVLKGKNYEVMYSEFLGAHDAYSWKQTLPDALTYVLSKQ